MSIPLITVQDLQISQASKTLINRVDFSIHRHDRIILVGENGSGKSTLLKTIKKLHEPDNGIIWIAPNIKIKWKILAINHHPDRLIAKGMPEDFIEKSTTRLQEINNAWDIIQKEKIR